MHAGAELLAGGVGFTNVVCLLLHIYLDKKEAYTESVGALNVWKTMLLWAPIVWVEYFMDNSRRFSISLAPFFISMHCIYNQFLS